MTKYPEINLYRVAIIASPADVLKPIEMSIHSFGDQEYKFSDELIADYYNNRAYRG